MRRLLLLLSLGAFLAAVEGRVVFHSFGQYMRLPPPWSYVAVSVAVYGVASLVLLHFSGALGEEAESESVAVCAVLALPCAPGLVGQEGERAGVGALALMGRGAAHPSQASWWARC